MYARVLMCAFSVRVYVCMINDIFHQEAVARVCMHACMYVWMRVWMFATR